jgi:hypothetical protein
MAVGMSNPDSPVCESETPAAVALIARREKRSSTPRKPPASRSPACAKPSPSMKTSTDGGALILVATERARDFPQNLPLA